MQQAHANNYQSENATRHFKQPTRVHDNTKLNASLLPPYLESLPKRVTSPARSRGRFVLFILVQRASTISLCWLPPEDTGEEASGTFCDLMILRNSTKLRLNAPRTAEPDERAHFASSSTHRIATNTVEPHAVRVGFSGHSHLRV